MWTLESVKNFHFKGSFWAKFISFELKKYRGVIFHETEEGYKIWRGIDLSFQNWHKEFDKFWPEHSKVSKVFTLLGFFWAKYIAFELKKYREVGWDEEGCKIWRGINLSSQTWHKKFDKFWPEHSKVSKIKLKRDTKFGEKSTCHFKIDIRNLTHFDLSTRKSQKLSL